MDMYGMFICVAAINLIAVIRCVMVICVDIPVCNQGKLWHYKRPDILLCIKKKPEGIW